MKTKVKYWLIGCLSGIGLFFVFGVPTGLIPSPWFARMVSKTFLDYLFLVLSSILLGSYIGVHFYKRTISKKCNVLTYSGGVGSVLAFGCPICNKLLVLLFGTTALMAYLNPFRPALGTASVVLLGSALYWKLKSDKNRV